MLWRMGGELAKVIWFLRYQLKSEHWLSIYLSLKKKKNPIRLMRWPRQMHPGTRHMHTNKINLNLRMTEHLDDKSPQGVGVQLHASYSSPWEPGVSICLGHLGLCSKICLKAKQKTHTRNSLRCGVAFL